MNSVFFEMEFVLLVMFSIVIPVGTYVFLYRRFAISRWTVVGFAILLIAISGIDVILLQSLSETAKSTSSALDDKFFASQMSLALYLFPAVFGGLGVNLLTHILVNHLDEAETEFDKVHPAPAKREGDTFRQWLSGNGISGSPSQAVVLTGSTMVTAVIFVLDLASGAEIRLHVLYIFPLAMIARHCNRLWITITALVITTILQVFTFSQEVISAPSFITDVAVAIAASLAIVYWAATARDTYLEIATQAALDPLTGLANRREFTAKLESEITRQKRYGGLFSLAVLDLDGFKTLNDSKGHVAGDDALKLVSDILRDSTRASDSVGRLGGDEFAVILPNTPEAVCGEMIRELCVTVAARMKIVGFPITASIGCKTFSEPPDNPVDALNQADKLMYDAKISGKNRALNS